MKCGWGSAMTLESWSKWLFFYVGGSVPETARRDCSLLVECRRVYISLGSADSVSYLCTFYPASLHGCYRSLYLSLIWVCSESNNVFKHNSNIHGERDIGLFIKASVCFLAENHAPKSIKAVKPHKDNILTLCSRKKLWSSFRKKQDRNKLKVQRLKCEELHLKQKMGGVYLVQFGNF